MSDHYTRSGTFPLGNLARGDTVQNEFDLVETGFDTLEAEVDQSFRFTNADLTTPITFSENAASRTNMLLGFDSSGDPALIATTGTTLRDLNGQEFILDADGDTTITADTDDQVDFKIAGADDFQMTANTFTALSGSVIKTNTINETTAGNGVVIDSVTLKDGGVNGPSGTLNVAATTLSFDAASTIDASGNELTLGDDVRIVDSTPMLTLQPTADSQSARISFDNTAGTEVGRINFDYGSGTEVFDIRVGGVAAGNIALVADQNQDIYIGGGSASPSARLHVEDSDTALLQLTTTASGATGATVTSYTNSSSPIDDDVIFRWSIQGNTDDGGGGVTSTKFVYGQLQMIVQDTSDTSEDSQFDILCREDGNSRTMSWGPRLPGQRAVLFLQDSAGTTDTPLSGGYFYVTSGALHWVGSSGTDTTVAAA